MAKATGPRRDYRTKDGTRVPGVTTVIGRFKESGGLVHWAWELGREGKDYRQERDSAADAGTLAHAWIDDLIHERPKSEATGYTQEQQNNASEALDAFKRWLDVTGLKITETEIPLVSEKHRFGGTIDALGSEGEKMVVLDWKTSKRVYHDYLYQIAAYGLLLRENRGTVPEEFHLVRLDKEHASVHHHSWRKASLHKAAQAFVLMRQLYDLDKVVKDML